MSAYSAVLQDLITLSRSLGDPARDLAILGEGNTSALVDESTFLVKASGKELRSADEESFLAVSMYRALDVLNGPDLSDTEVRQALLSVKVELAEFPHMEFEDQTARIKNSVVPSVETFLHAYLLSLPGINFVGHTHPSAVNSILCSVNSKEAV